jgi:hypothetical protein
LLHKRHWNQISECQLSLGKQAVDSSEPTGTTD